MSDPLAQQAVDAIDAVSGRHPGVRAAHAKGTFASGRFTPSAEAARTCRAAHLQRPTTVLARFSNGSGNPHEPDTHRLDGRGFAVKFELGDGRVTDLVSLSLPCFFARTPEDFVAFTGARRPDPDTGQPDMAALGAFMEAHPETGAALAVIVPTFVPPASYATCTYNSIHAFRLRAPDDTQTVVRWRWEPAAGVAALSDDELAACGPDYLQEELRARLQEGEVRFSLHAILAAPGDDPDDPTVPWPETRERLSMGVLELDAVVDEREVGDHIEVFDPMRLVDGVEASGDPILHFRSRAYDVSATRRWPGAPGAG